jgi:DNA replication protein DnaC
MSTEHDTTDSFDSILAKMRQYAKPVPQEWICEWHGAYPSEGKDGRYLTFECPTCLRETKALCGAYAAKVSQHRAWLRSGIASRYLNRDLSNYTARTPELESVLGSVKSFAAQMLHGDVSALVLSGDVGLGKSHLCAGIVAEG